MYIFWDNVSGNDLNTGLTEAQAVKTISAVITLLNANSGFGLRQKATGVDYALATVGGTTVSTWTGTILDWQPFPADIILGNKPVNVITRTSNAIFVSLASFVKNVDFTVDDNSTISSTASCQNQIVGLNAVGCYFKHDVLNVSNSSLWMQYTGTVGNQQFFDCWFEITKCANAASTRTSKWAIADDAATTNNVRTRAINCKFKINQYGTAMTGAGADGNFYKNCLFEFILCGTGAGVRGLDIPFTTSTTTRNSFLNNTIIINQDPVEYPGSIIAGTIVNSGMVCEHSENVYINNTIGDFSLYYAASSTTITTSANLFQTGNNLIIKTNATGTVAEKTNVLIADNYYSLFGLNTTENISIVNPFLSIDPLNSNFLRYDVSSTDYLSYIKNKGIIQFNGNIGADTNTVSASGGYPLLPAGDVKIGVDRGDGSFGSYDGSDRHSDPGIANVRNGTAYKSNSTTNNRTGSAYIPSPSDVRLGTNVDATTGTLDLPAIGDVKDGVFYDNNTKEGTYDPITGNWEAVSAADLRSGVSKLQNGSTVNGLLNLPSEANVRQGTSYDNNTKTGTLDLPAENNVRFGTSYDNATKTGSVYIPNASDVRDGVNVDATVGTLDLPLEADVKAGVDYDGNTKTGSYDPITGFWQPISADDVRAGVQALQNGALITGLLNLPAISDVRQGTSYDNATKTGTLDIDSEANLPDPADVLIGSGNYGENLDITPAYSPDFPDALNVRETDSTNGVQGLIPQNKIAPSQGGSYLGEESNDNIDPSIVVQGNDYLNLGENKTGTATGSEIDPKYILYPFGTLGQINGDATDIAKQLQENAELFMTNLLGNEWQKLKYFKEPEKNDFYSNANQFGIRATGDTLTNEKIGKDTLDVDFEIKLTTDFDNRDGDEDERTQELYLIQKMEEIRRQLRLTKFFKADKVRIVRDYNREEVEKIGDNVILLTATLTVNLDIKNG